MFQTLLNPISWSIVMPLDKILLYAVKALGRAVGVLSKKDPGTRSRSGTSSALQRNPALNAVITICVIALGFSATSVYFSMNTPTPVLPDESYRDLYERSMKRNEEYVIKVEKLTAVNNKLKALVQQSQSDNKDLTVRYERVNKANVKLSKQLEEVNSQYFTEVKTAANLLLQLQAVRIKLSSKCESPTVNDSYITEYPDVKQGTKPINPPIIIKPKPEEDTTLSLKDLIDNIKKEG